MVSPLCVGTPPPARGPQGRGDREGRIRRNTPACAGTTARSSRARCRWTEHPRLRGDHGTFGPDGPGVDGTPPPARGPLPLPHTVAGGSGTPPPARGHAPEKVPNFAAAGTPPPARGPRRTSGKPSRTGRNTPACAGTTRRRCGGGTPAPEHPRLRGDHCLSLGLKAGSTGTPPPARGPPLLQVLADGVQRNTPACAGTTCATAGLAPRSPEHPRLRGDHFLAVPSAPPAFGTPPPARGPRL